VGRELSLQKDRVKNLTSANQGKLVEPQEFVLKRKFLF